MDCAKLTYLLAFVQLLSWVCDAVKAVLAWENASKLVRFIFVASILGLLVLVLSGLNDLALFVVGLHIVVIVIQLIAKLTKYEKLAFSYLGSGMLIMIVGAIYGVVTDYDQSFQCVLLSMIFGTSLVYIARGMLAESIKFYAVALYLLVLGILFLPNAINPLPAFFPWHLEQ
ncbi:MAG: hypothetical protein P1U89_01270 [Verrucomicrobiales bacterium]|nr:hypothetical protein [Verrucomicrobiales bacterium]